MHIVGNAESRCRTKVRGPHIVVMSLNDWKPMCEWCVLGEFTSENRRTTCNKKYGPIYSL